MPLDGFIFTAHVEYTHGDYQLGDVPTDRQVVHVAFLSGETSFFFAVRTERMRSAGPDEAAGVDSYSPYRICFVCLGNICRSPMAEIVTRDLLAEAGLAERVTVASTGTGDWHLGGPANPGSVRALAARGYDASRHRARQLTARTVADYDLLVGLDTANVRDVEWLLDGLDDADRPEVRLLRDYAPEGGPGLGVPDPYGQGADAFDHALDLVEDACRGLVEELRKRF